MARRPTISKSAFIRGRQCLKSLYLIKNFPGLRDPVSASQQAVFDRGHTVGELAQRLFPGGSMAAFDLPEGFMKSIWRTRSLVEQGAAIIYEAGFMVNNTHCFADILVRDGAQWKVYEVKSSTKLSDVYRYDAAFQYRVLRSAGLDISDISIIYINNQYERTGELDLHRLFTIESVLEQSLAMQDEVNDLLGLQVNILQQPEIPDIAIGPHCSDPYDCDFMGHCWSGIPDYSVFDISRLAASKKFDLFNQGILTPKDIPADFPLSNNQQLQVEGDRTGETLIDRAGLSAFMDALHYPLYFLDFETFNPVIPLYDHSRPYQQIVFQYSLHILERPGAELRHHEFLAPATGDPRIAMISQLLEDIGPDGDIVVYNQGFETGRLNEIARDFPRHQVAIDRFLARIKDLMVPFQQKLLYTPAMQGSYSIKQVLPALCPGFTYESLEIGNGTDASLAFEGLLHETDPKTIEKTRNALLAYCELDTLAMVELLKVLAEYVNGIR